MFEKKSLKRINVMTYDIKSLGFSSEPAFNVNYHGHTEMEFDPSIYDADYVYISEVIENCKKWNCRATLWDGTSQYKEGTVYPDGNYQYYYNNRH
jgi:hypothetical protein